MIATQENHKRYTSPLSFPLNALREKYLSVDQLDFFEDTPDQFTEEIEYDFAIMKALEKNGKKNKSQISAYLLFENFRFLSGMRKVGDPPVVKQSMTEEDWAAAVAEVKAKHIENEHEEQATDVEAEYEEHDFLSSDHEEQRRLEKLACEPKREEQRCLEKLGEPDLKEAKEIVEQGDCPEKYRFQTLIGESRFGKIYIAEDLERKEQVPVVVKNIGNSQRVFAFSEIVSLNRFLSNLNGEKLDKRQKFEKRRLIIINLVEFVVNGHGEGIVFGELNPSNNIFVDPVTLAVFVFDWAVRGRTARLNLVQSGFACQSPCFVSPEMIACKSLNKVSDIFCLGILISFIMGGVPFKGNNFHETIEKIKKYPPEFPPGMPNALAAIVKNCLEKKPSCRYQSAEDVLFDLEYLLEIELENTAEHWVAAVLPTKGPDVRSRVRQIWNRIREFWHGRFQTRNRRSYR